MQDTTFDDFKKYFNHDFRKAFIDNVLFYPEVSQEMKDNVVSQLYWDIQNKGYYPSVPKTVLYQEKGNGVARIIPVFEIKDYCLYYYCIKRLEERIATNRTPNTFWGWSLGWIIRKYEESEVEEQESEMQWYENELANYHGISISEYSFNPQARVRAYWDFSAKLFATIKTCKFEYCVEFDIANFYDCINLDILEVLIREVTDTNDSEIVSILFHFLHYWNRGNYYYNKCTVGLPQDALSDCSRILANFYLRSYDKYIHDECWTTFSYLRYADDQFIFGDSIEDLKEKVLKASIFLNKYWLSINQKKVKYHSTKALMSYRSFALYDLVSPENINEKTINQFVAEVVSIFKCGRQKDLKDEGISLKNRATSLDLTKVAIGDKVFLKWLFLDSEYLKQAKTRQFEKIYEILEENERREFLENLIKIAEDYKYNQFHYSVLQFFQNKGLDQKSILKIMIKLDIYFNPPIEML